MKNDLDDLIGRLKQNDKEAFNLLFYMYAEKLFKFSLTFFNEETEAEEIVQEVFLKIWLKRKTISDPSTFNAYIYTIAKNLIFNNLKKIFIKRNTNPICIQIIRLIPTKPKMKCCMKKQNKE